MGYFKSPNGTRSYEPDDGEFHFYLAHGATIDEILTKSQEKWGNYIDFENIKIDAEYIHTDCLGYDCFDSSDWTEYLCITFTGTLTKGE